VVRLPAVGWSIGLIAQLDDRAEQRHVLVFHATFGAREQGLLQRGAVELRGEDQAVARQVMDVRVKQYLLTKMVGDATCTSSFSTLSFSSPR
jgi:hypothetical protein